MSKLIFNFYVECKMLMLLINFILFLLCFCVLCLVILLFIWNLFYEGEFFEYVGQEILGMEITIRNSEVLAKDQAAVVVENHQSSLEILLVFQIWRKVVKKMIGVSKKDLLYLFPYGQTNYLLGTMFLDRKTASNAYKELERVGGELVKKKAKAWMHPEGTRNRDQNKFLPFKRGAFYLAVKAQVPIIPVVVSPYYFLDYKKPTFNKPRIIMQVLDEISTVGLTTEDLPELITKIRDQMWETYQKLSNEVKSKYEHKDENNHPSAGSLIIE